MKTRNTIKEPWIPPPAKTTRSPKKEKQKVEFDPTYIAVKKKNYSEKSDFGNEKYNLTTYGPTQLQMQEADERLHALDIAQKLSFEKSLQRLEHLQEMMKDDEMIRDSNENKSYKSSEIWNKNEQAAENDDIQEQAQNLVYKLRDFEANSSMLRNLLKDTKNIPPAENPSLHEEYGRDSALIYTKDHQTELNSTKDDLLADTTVLCNINENCDLHEKKIELLQDTINNLQLENQKLLSIKKVQEENRAQMQREIHRKEANLNRLQTHLNTPDTELFAQDQISQKEREIELIKTSLMAEKETWKRLLKLEKKKSAKNAEIIENLKSKASSQTSQIKEVEEECRSYKIEVDNLTQIRILSESELSILRERVGELELLIQKMGADKLLDKNTNEAVGCQNCSDEAQLPSTATEIQKRNSNLTGHQSEIIKNVNLANSAQDTSNYSKDGMKSQLNDQSKNIEKLASKFEQQAKQIQNLSQHTNCSSADRLQYENKIEALNKRIHETEQSNFEISLQLAKFEENVKSAELRLNEKSQVYSDSIKKLENALSDAKHESEILKEKLLTQEKQNHAYSSETQTHLSHKNMQIEQIKQSKKEIEETLTAKLSDLRNRLEHSQNTNRSLQNYVTFLKTSYATVFSDQSFSTLSTPSKIN